MKLHRQRCKLLLCLLLILGLGSFSVCASAERGIDMNREGSIVLSCKYAGKPVSGGNLLLYGVADVEMDANGNYSFRLLDRFGGDRLLQADLDDSSLPGRLVGSGELGSLPYRSTVFDTNGEARFEGVKPGLYLLMQTVPAKGYQKMGTILVSVPMYDPATDGYSYDVDASVKPAVEREVKPTPTPTPPPGERIPQTGQMNWPVPALAVMGLVSILIGVLLLRADKAGARGRET